MSLVRSPETYSRSCGLVATLAGKDVWSIVCAPLLLVVPNGSVSLAFAEPLDRETHGIITVGATKVAAQSHLPTIPTHRRMIATAAARWSNPAFENQFIPPGNHLVLTKPNTHEIAINSQTVGAASRYWR